MVQQLSFPDIQAVPPLVPETGGKTERIPPPPLNLPSSGAGGAVEALVKEPPAQEGPKGVITAEELTEAQRDSLKNAFHNLNSIMQHFAKAIRFAIYEQSDDLYAQVINTETNEVVKTIPSEKALEMMQRIHEVLGMLVDEKG
ncbi:MAG: flagellar protein FlaG [Planctomycetota bacterium]